MRTENKYFISKPDSVVLRQLLRTCMTSDENAFDGDSYIIRSVYFDDKDGTAYCEKNDGVQYREKFRLRIYNNDRSYILLEKKVKNGDYTEKYQETVSFETAKALLEGDCVSDGGRLLSEFLLKKKLNGLSPDITVEYRRKAFIYPSQNTRITFDSDLKAGTGTGFFSPDMPLVLLPDTDREILEIKFDRFFPPYLSSIVSSVPSERFAISKFAICKEIFMGWETT